MEVTNGLLSNLVHTKAIEGVLAPIASQVYRDYSHIILAIQIGWDNLI